MSAIFDVALGGFTECAGLEMTLKTEDYREGGNNGAVLHFPSRVEWGTITLKKGVGGTAPVGLALRLRRRDRASVATA